VVTVRRGDCNGEVGEKLGLRIIAKKDYAGCECGRDIVVALDWWF